jgi:hypothetical protein
MMRPDPRHPRALGERRPCAQRRHGRLRGSTDGARLQAAQLDLIAHRVTASISATPARLALRLGEAADALGVSHDYFRSDIASELRIVRRGRVQLVAVSELERWMDEHASYAIEN